MPTLTAAPELYSDIQTLIIQTKQQTAVAVNAALTMMYWQIGQRINQELLKGERAEYGKQIVAIDLKLGKFKPHYKGQMELYLRWLDKHERQAGEQAPLGIILCAQKNQEQIELLEMDDAGIHVAEYLAAFPK